MQDLTKIEEQRTKYKAFMRVTIGQINTTNGEYAGNTAAIIRAIEQGKKDQSDLVVLPEVAIQGYTSLDWCLDRDIIPRSLEPLDQIIAATEGITAIVGTVRPSNLPTGRRLFNSAAVISNKQLIGFADKNLRASGIFSISKIAIWASLCVKTSGMTRPSGENVFIHTIRRTS